MFPDPALHLIGVQVDEAMFRYSLRNQIPLSTAGVKKAKKTSLTLATSRVQKKSFNESTISIDLSSHSANRSGIRTPSAYRSEKAYSRIQKIPDSKQIVTAGTGSESAT